MKAVLFLLIVSIAASLGVGQRSAVNGSRKPAQKITAKEAESDPKPTPTPSESVSFDSAVATPDPFDRVTALNKFLEDFPDTERRALIAETIVAARGDAANAQLSLGDPAKAIALLNAAIEEAPTPFSDRVFSEVIGKFPNLLFVYGQNEAAVRMADAIEKRSEGNSRQLLALAGFFISTENSTAALRLANKALEIEPNSPSAYQILGLAHRLNFDLEGAAAAFSKALELDPASVTALRSLAEIKRATAKPDESLVLFKKLLEANADDPAAQAGVVLALFDLGRKPEAEAAFDKAMKDNPGNVALAGNVAFWYAVNGDAANAILHAEEAIDLEPRYIWSHIALGRALMMQGKFADAEKALIKARKHGRFPTLEYEIGLARVASGYYRDALEDVRSVFAASNGQVGTLLGGRVSRTAGSFHDLLADERRASIFEPRSIERTDLSEQLLRLIELGQSIERGDPETIANAARKFASGSDPMQLHRQLFTASALLEKQAAQDTVLELIKDATTRVDAGLDVKNASTAVLAGELYERRRTAIAAEQFIVVPEIARPMLSAVVRGRIEETAGWAFFQQGKFDDAEIRLKRAITVLPKDSAWWRSSTWRLGATLEAKGQDKEALDSYVASYRSEPGSGAKFLTIRSVYQRLNGNTDELESLVGPSPIDLQTAVIAEPIKKEADVPSETLPETTVKIAEPVTEEKAPIASATPEPKPAAELIEPIKTESPQPVRVDELLKPATVDETSERKETKKEETPGVAKPEPSEEKKPEPELIAVTVAEQKPAEQRSVTEPEKPFEPVQAVSTGTKSLFDPVIITIPNSRAAKIVVPVANEIKQVPLSEPTQVASNVVEEKTANLGSSEEIASDGTLRKRTVDGATIQTAVPSCTINISQNSVSLLNQVGSVLMLVGTGSDQDAALVTAISNKPADVEVRAEPAVEGISGRSLFLIRSRSVKTGLFQVTFALPCGSKTVNVNVR